MNDNIVDVVRDIIKRDEKTRPYDTTAKVTRIDGNTAWVHIDGGVSETPVKMTIDAAVGDTVQVRVGGGTAFLVGNETAPPTDDTTAFYARDIAVSARDAASTAYKYADTALEHADNAYSLAGTAKASADGKNTIYRGATQPTGGTYVTGDIWFDTANDNKIYRYNGSSWVGFTLGDDALDSISANKITAGTIDASVITVSNLDAGKITSGTLNSDRIDASTLTIGGSGLATTADVSDVQAEIDAKKSVHTLMSSSTTGSTYANILSWTEEGHANSSWGINTTATPLTNVKIGDTCRVAYKVSDMNGAYVYVVGEVTSISGSTIYMTMHGLDTTIIDGGNIITNSIGANQIAANAIDTTKLTVGTQNDVLNSNIIVGGRNLCKNTGFNDLSMWYGSPSVSDGKLTITTATEVGISADYRTSYTIPAGTSYTVSCYFYENTIADGNRRIYFRDQPAWDYWTVPANFTGLFSRTATASTDITRLTVEYDTRNATSGKWVVGPVKIELGNKATDWTPAPEETAATATSYITDIDSKNGITIKAVNGTTTANTSTSNYLKLNANDGLEIYKAGVSVAKYGGDTARVGKEASGHATIKADGLHVWKGTESTANNEVATFTSDGASIVSTSGNYISDFEIYNQSDIAYISTSARSNYNLGGFIIKNTSGSEDIDAAIALSAAYSNISSLASALEMLLSLSSSNGLKMVVAGNEKFSVSNQGAVSVGGYKLITTDTVTKAGSSISGGGYDTISVSATKTGYTPIGIIGYQITGTNSQNIVPYRMYLNDTTAEARVKNVGSSAITPSVTFYILYIASGQGI